MEFATEQESATDEVAVVGVAVGGREGGVGVVTGVEQVLEREFPHSTFSLVLGGGTEDGGRFVLVGGQLLANDVGIHLQFQMVDGVDAQVADGGEGIEDVGGAEPPCVATREAAFACQLHPCKGVVGGLAAEGVAIVVGGDERALRHGLVAAPVAGGLEDEFGVDGDVRLRDAQVGRGGAEVAVAQERCACHVGAADGLGGEGVAFTLVPCRVRHDGEVTVRNLELIVEVGGPGLLLADDARGGRLGAVGGVDGCGEQVEDVAYGGGEAAVEAQFRLAVEGVAERKKRVEIGEGKGAVGVVQMQPAQGGSCTDVDVLFGRPPLGVGIEGWGDFPAADTLSGLNHLVVGLEVEGDVDAPLRVDVPLVAGAVGGEERGALGLFGQVVHGERDAGRALQLHVGVEAPLLFADAEFGLEGVGEVEGGGGAVLGGGDGGKTAIRRWKGGGAAIRRGEGGDGAAVLLELGFEVEVFAEIVVGGIVFVFQFQMGEMEACPRTGGLVDAGVQPLAQIGGLGGEGVVLLLVGVVGIGAHLSGAVQSEDAVEAAIGIGLIEVLAHGWLATAPSGQFAQGEGGDGAVAEVVNHVVGAEASVIAPLGRGDGLEVVGEHHACHSKHPSYPPKGGRTVRMVLLPLGGGWEGASPADAQDGFAKGLELCFLRQFHVQCHVGTLLVRVNLLRLVVAQHLHLAGVFGRDVLGGQVVLATQHVESLDVELADGPPHVADGSCARHLDARQPFQPIFQGHIAFAEEGSEVVGECVAHQTQGWGFHLHFPQGDGAGNEHHVKD